MRRRWFPRARRQSADGRRFYPPAPEDAIPSAPPRPAPSVVAPPRCDRSGDLGTKHYWRDGAVVGDLCLCGKRAKLKPPPPLDGGI